MSSPNAASAGFPSLAYARAPDSLTDDRQRLAWAGASDATEATQAAAEIAADAQRVIRFDARIFICVLPFERRNQPAPARLLDLRASPNTG